MKLEFTKEEISLIGDLVFLGNWILNSHRLSDVQIKEYETISAKIESLHKKLLSSAEKDLHIDMSDYYMNKLNNYISDYDEEGYLFTLAEKLSEVNYPINQNATRYYDSATMQTDAQHIYENEFKKKGLSIINIDIPDMDEQLEVYRQKRKEKPLQ